MHNYNNSIHCETNFGIMQHSGLIVDAIPEDKMMGEHPSFHQSITAEEAVRRLKMSSRNCYLTSYSNTHKFYILTVYCKRKPSDVVEHFGIHITGQKYKLKGATTEFNSIESLLKHYEDNRISPSLPNIGRCYSQQEYDEQDEAERQEDDQESELTKQTKELMEQLKKLEEELQASKEERQHELKIIEKQNLQEIEVAMRAAEQHKQQVLLAAMKAAEHQKQQELQAVKEKNQEELQKIEKEKHQELVKAAQEWQQQMDKLLEIEPIQSASKSLQSMKWQDPMSLTSSSSETGTADS